MDDNLDLDISHYDISELITFFQLNKNTTYTESDLERIEYDKKQLLLSSGQINKHYTRDLISFMSAARKKLIPHLCQQKQISVTPKPPDDNNYPHVEYSTGNRAPVIPYPSLTAIQTHFVSVDTRFRENAYLVPATNFAIQLPNKITQAISLKLSSFEISRHAFINISQSLGNHYIYFDIITQTQIPVANTQIKSLSHDVTKYPVILDDGHYTTFSIIKAINTKLHSDPLSPLFHLNVELDATETERAVIYSTSDNIISFSINMGVDAAGNSDLKTNEYYLKLGRVLGFTKRVYTNNNIYVGETNINTDLSISYFYLEIEEFANNYAPQFISPFAKAALNPAILAKIAINNNPEFKNNIIITGDLRLYMGSIDITRLHVRLVDAYGRLLLLNNVDFSFTLQIQYATAIPA